MPTLEELARVTSTSDKAAFERMYPERALLFLNGILGTAEGTTKTAKLRKGDTNKETGKFRTDIHQNLSLKTTMAETHDGDGLAPTFRITGECEVVFLKKTDRNSFLTMITVGRASNNDIWIPLTSVSKMHAYFVQEAGQWKLTDQHSTNGTVVGDALLRGQSLLLKDGVVIDFGPEVRAKLFSPAALFEFLGEFRAGRPLTV